MVGHFATTLPLRCYLFAMTPFWFIHSLPLYCSNTPHSDCIHFVLYLFGCWFSSYLLPGYTFRLFTQFNTLQTTAGLAPYSKRRVTHYSLPPSHYHTLPLLRLHHRRTLCHLLPPPSHTYTHTHLLHSLHAHTHLPFFAVAVPLPPATHAVSTHLLLPPPTYPFCLHIWTFVDSWCVSSQPHITVIYCGITGWFVRYLPFVPLPPCHGLPVVHWCLAWHCSLTHLPPCSHLQLLHYPTVCAIPHTLLDPYAYLPLVVPLPYTCLLPFILLPHTHVGLTLPLLPCYTLLPGTLPWVVLPHTHVYTHIWLYSLFYTRYLPAGYIYVYIATTRFLPTRTTLQFYLDYIG